MMTGKGLAKLIEECGELTQKRLAFYHTDAHPDGTVSLTSRLEEEIADVLAVIKLVSTEHQLNYDKIEARMDAKLCLFEKWMKDTTNNTHGIDS